MDEDELYDLPLEQFVHERNALAKALRASGKRDDAERVAKLRKPSASAWAVNQLARTQRRAMNELFAAGDELIQAQRQVLAGRGEPTSLRGAMDRQRAAVEQLQAAAEGLLSSEGHGLSSTMIERVGETLTAAALDPDARRAVRDGRLERELRHVGLVVGAAPARRRNSPKRKPRVSRQAGRALAAAQARHERAERALQEAERALAAAQTEADAAAEAHRQALAQAEAEDA